jgi:hypothetical protein
MDEKQLSEKKQEAFRIGVAVIVILATLTVGEFWLGSVASGWWAPLIGVALLKAFFVVRDYMHIGRLFAAEEAHE